MCNNNVDKVHEVRVIKPYDSREPNEVVVKVTMELTQAEIVELHLAMKRHMQVMTIKNYHYHDMKNIQRTIDDGLKKLHEAGVKPVKGAYHVS